MKPNRKPTIGAFSGALAALVASFTDLDASQTAALVIVITFAVSYMVPERIA